MPVFTIESTSPLPESETLEIILRQEGGKILKDARAAASQFSKSRHQPHTYQRGPKAGKTEKPLRAANITMKLKRSAGDLEGVAFNFPRHGIFLEYGVGRGHPAGKMPRTKSDWLSRSMQNHAQHLIDRAALFEGGKVLRVII